MNLLAFVILLLLATAWIVLPLIPALRELFRPPTSSPSPWWAATTPMFRASPETSATT
jgi:hypothetical protein